MKLLYLFYFNTIGRINRCRRNAGAVYLIALMLLYESMKATGRPDDRR